VLSAMRRKMVGMELRYRRRPAEGFTCLDLHLRPVRHGHVQVLARRDHAHCNHPPAARPSRTCHEGSHRQRALLGKDTSCQNRIRSPDLQPACTGGKKAAEGKGDESRRHHRGKACRAYSAEPRS